MVILLKNVSSMSSPNEEQSLSRTCVIGVRVRLRLRLRLRVRVRVRLWVGLWFRLWGKAGKQYTCSP